ncbi:uncharacterized protein T26G10.4-like [Ornithodoros turicata]|uniref:uncharacterized protein T26G10.4-like n=1 Tax=Ornithodoros turicata TaxID=34597 RepID=UPI003138AB91
MAKSEVRLQARIDQAASLLRQIGLKLNAAKCRSLFISERQPVGLRDVICKVDGTPIGCLRDFESFPYLGRPVGYNIFRDNGEVDEAIELGKKLLNSCLAPWQRIDAIKTFLYPSLKFAMRCGVLGKTDWSRLDNALRPLIKRSLYLPKSASTDYLYSSSKAGACGIPLTTEISDICRLDSAFKLLTSRDQEVSAIAMSSLTRTVDKRLGRECGIEELCQYLSGENEGDFRLRSNQLRNVWTEARKASSTLGVSWDLEEGNISITRENQTITASQRTKLMAIIRSQLTLARDQSLRELPSLGKVMDCVYRDKASSHFIRTGTFTSFAQWRFIHRAHLNLLPVNGARPWARNDDRQCRRWGHSNETLPHVLDHCMPSSASYQARHNEIVESVKAAARGKYTAISENMAVGGTGLRPDLILCRGEEAIIVDVTIPFDNRYQALAAARAEKEAKYELLKPHLQRRFHRVSVQAIVVGALGSWDPANNKVMKKLCTKSYLGVFKKLCVSNVIAASRNIYVEHVTGNPIV